MTNTGHLLAKRSYRVPPCLVVKSPIEICFHAGDIFWDVTSCNLYDLRSSVGLHGVMSQRTVFSSCRLLTKRTNCNIVR